MTHVPAGWYPDPDAPPGYTPVPRWWDGERWTDRWQQPAAPPLSGRTTPDGRGLAGWWRRVLGSVMDTVVGAILGFLVGLPVQAEYQRVVQAEGERLQRRLAEGDDDAFGDYWQAILTYAADHWVWLLLVPFAAVAAYHAGFLRWRGATLGKLMLEMRVEPVARPGPLSWPSIALRIGVQFGLVWLVLIAAVLVGDPGPLAVAYGVVVVVWLADGLWAAGPRRRALHDLAAGTVVVRTR